MSGGGEELPSDPDEMENSNDELEGDDEISESKAKKPRITNPHKMGKFRLRVYVC